MVRRPHPDGAPADGSAAPLVPPHPTLPSLRAAAAGCRACPLWERGTQTVFGDGPPLAEVMLVGEQPGNDEDRAGAPFVGPAGRLLDRALAAAGGLDAELKVVRPRAIVCLGATAAQALLGRAFRVTEHRGELVPSPLAPLVMATVHPSSILRAPDDATRRIELERLVEDLAALAAALRYSAELNP